MTASLLLWPPSSPVPAPQCGCPIAVSPCPPQQELQAPSSPLHGESKHRRAFNSCSSPLADPSLHPPFTSRRSETLALHPFPSSLRPVSPPPPPTTPRLHGYCLCHLPGLLLCEAPSNLHWLRAGVMLDCPPGNGVSMFPAFPGDLSCAHFQGQSTNW